MSESYNLLPDTPTVIFAGKEFPVGWVDDPEQVAQSVAALDANEETGPAEFAQAAPDILGSGEGKTALLFLAVRKYIPEDYVIKQTVGDCTSQGASGAVLTVSCVQEEFGGVIATEPIYGFGRVEVARGRFGRGDGATGAAVAQAVADWGTLLRKDYGGGDLDLSTYSGAKARRWGMPGAGVPDQVEPEARQHLIKTVSRLRTWEEARDAICNGYPVTIASGVGFGPAGGNRRNSEGALEAAGSWQHQMFCDAYRPGYFLVHNSWGRSWISGPKVLEQPDGTFWARESVIGYICKNAEAFAYSQFLSFKPQAIDYLLI
jgi:hypothetical protein